MNDIDDQSIAFRLKAAEAENELLHETIQKRFVDECAFCGAIFPPSMYEEAKKHVNICPDNPKNKRIAKLEAILRPMGYHDVEKYYKDEND